MLAILVRVVLISVVTVSETGKRAITVSGAKAIDTVDSDVVDSRHVCGGHGGSLKISERPVLLRYYCLYTVCVRWKLGYGC